MQRFRWQVLSFQNSSLIHLSGESSLKKVPEALQKKVTYLSHEVHFQIFWELAQTQQCFGYRNYKEILRPIEVREYFLLLSLHFIKTLQY